MRVSFDGDVTGDDWVMRYSINLFGMDMERRPVAQAPDCEGLYFVDFGSRLNPGPSSAAIWKGGEWLRLNRKPFKATVQHWTRHQEGGPLVPLKENAIG